MLSNYGTNSVCNQSEETLQEMVDKLIHESSIFQKVFSNTELQLNPEESEDVRRKFSEIYPNQDFKDFINRYNKKSEEECNSVIYDPQNKKFYNPKILSPILKKKSEKFNVVEFLKEEQLKQKIIYFNFDVEHEVCLDVPYEEKKKLDIMIDQSLKSVAELALILNQQGSEIPYHLIEIHNESRVN